MPHDYCRKCGDPIMAQYETKVFPIQGYEETRAGGGQNHVLRKHRVDGFVWHRRCWEEIMRKHDDAGLQLQLDTPGDE